jgi:5'-3' exonuclease
MHLIIDCSYVVYYRYHALSVWYKHSKQEVGPNHGDIMSDVDFLERYQRLFIQAIKKLRKTYGTEKVYFATDCHSSCMWRRMIYPEYKANRSSNGKFDKNIFGYVYEEILPMIEGGIVLGVEGAEGDDIIYVLKRFIREREEEAEIVIISSDADMGQLWDDRCNIIDMKGKNMVITDAKNSLMKKIIGGDKSDNIKPIVSRFEKGQLDKLKCDTDELEGFLTKGGDDVRDRYEMNKTLIDMDCIPSDMYKSIFLSIYNTV